jgi:hypothetical protein
MSFDESRSELECLVMNVEMIDLPYFTVFVVN